MNTLNILMKPSSGLCNLRCKYCFYTDETQKREIASYGFMNENTLRNIISKTLSSAKKECTFIYQGGEPSLIGLDFYKKSVEFQSQYNQNNLIIHNSIQTNGYGLDDEWCAFFARHNFLVGISLDGIRQTHDCNRIDSQGNGTYFHILNFIDLLKKYKVEYNILTVINRQTYKKINRIYQQYEKQDFRYQQYIACLDPLFETAGQEPYSLTPSAYGKFLNELFDLWYNDLCQGKQPYIRQFDNYVGILLGMEPEACEQRGICGYQYVIESDGSVYPCDFYVLDQYRLGNLNEDSFETLEKKRDELHFIEPSTLHADSCKACKYHFICRNGCRRHRIFIENENGYLNYFCESYKMFFDKHLDQLKEIALKIQRSF